LIIIFIKVTNNPRKSWIICFKYIMEHGKSQLFWLLTVGSLANCLLVYIEATLLTPSNYVKNPLYPIIQ